MKKIPRKNLRALSERLSIDVEFLEQVSVHGAELPDPRSATPAEMARLRRLQRLCLALDLDAFAGALVVELLEHAESLSRELEVLRRSSR